MLPISHAVPIRNPGRKQGSHYCPLSADSPGEILRDWPADSPEVSVTDGGCCGLTLSSCGRPAERPRTDPCSFQASGVASVASSILRSLLGLSERMHVKCLRLFLECDEAPYTLPIILFLLLLKDQSGILPHGVLVFSTIDHIWDDSSFTALWLLILHDSLCNYKETESQRAMVVSFLCVWE